MISLLDILYCLNTISEQTLGVCPEEKPVPTIGSRPEGMLFRIMLRHTIMSFAELRVESQPA